MGPARAEVGKSARGLFVVMDIGRLLGVCGAEEVVERGCFLGLLSGELLRAIFFKKSLKNQLICKNLEQK